jgi:hypothetical protein
MVDDPVRAVPAQRICGWCRMEIAPGTRPATYGICPQCYVRMESDPRRKQKDEGVDT